MSCYGENGVREIIVDLAVALASRAGNIQEYPVIGARWGGYASRVYKPPLKYPPLYPLGYPNSAFGQCIKTSFYASFCIRHFDRDCERSHKPVYNRRANAIAAGRL